jgi:hypothetical protein
MYLLLLLASLIIRDDESSFKALEPKGLLETFSPSGEVSADGAPPDGGVPPVAPSTVAPPPMDAATIFPGVLWF